MRSNEVILTETLPAYFLFDYAKLGSFALTTKKERYILDEYAINYEGKIETPGHHFSTICKNISFPKKTQYSDNLSYPYRAIPCKYPYCFYIDVRRAFAQITQVFGLDCSHREGRYMAFGTTPLPEIFNDSKIMRALLISGVGPKSTLQEWKNGQLTKRQFPNRNHAPMLSRAILGFLHAVASELSPFTLYHHTDGFIIRYIHLRRVCDWLDRHGILYSIKAEGITEVYGVGSYRIGEQRTRNHHIQQQSHSNIWGDCAGWWLRQWDRGKALREG